MASVAQTASVRRTRTRVAIRRRLVHRLLVYAGLSAYGLIAVFPLYWLFKSSLTVGLDLIAPGPSFPPRALDFSNYERVLSVGLIVTFFANSLKVALISTVCTIAIASLAAYSLTRFRHRWLQLIQSSVLLAYMFPSILLAVPLALVYGQLGLINNHSGFMLVSCKLLHPLRL